MAPVSGSLLPLDIQRRMRGIMSERELLSLCRDAARREMRGANYSPDDKADCASVLMVTALVECSGTPPRSADRRYSLTAMCGRAKNYRRGLERERARDAADAAEQAESELWSVDPLAEYADAILNARPTMAEAAELGDIAVKRLSVGDILGAADLLTRLAMDVTSEVYSETIEVAHATYRQRESRAAKAIRQRYPDAASMLRELADMNPRPRLDPMDGSTVWWIGYRDHSRPAVTHGKTWSGKLLRNLAAEWRTGTAGGYRADRPVDAEMARAVCNVRTDRRLKPRPRPHGEAALRVEVESIKALGVALAHS